MRDIGHETIAIRGELKNQHDWLADSKSCFGVGQRELCMHIAWRILTKGGCC